MQRTSTAGVDYHVLSIEVEGDDDLRGYLAVDEEVRPGFGAVRYTVHVDSDADHETLDEIRHAAAQTSPMFDNVLNGVPVHAHVDAS